MGRIKFETKQILIQEKSLNKTFVVHFFLINKFVRKVYFKRLIRYRFCLKFSYANKK